MEEAALGIWPVVHVASSKCAGLYSSGKLLFSSAFAAVVSGCKCCPLAAIFYTNEKQTHPEEVISG